MNPQNGTCFTVPAWRTESVLQKNFTSLSARCWAGNPRIVKARSSHGSAVNMNEQAHDNMSAPPRQNDGDDGCSKMYCYSLRFLFYNPLIINSVCYAYFCRCFYRNSAMTCERTSVFLAIYFNKNLYTALGGIPCYIQDVEIKHYTLPGTIFGHLSHPPNPY